MQLEECPHPSIVSLHSQQVPYHNRQQMFKSPRMPLMSSQFNGRRPICTLSTSTYAQLRAPRGWPNQMARGLLAHLASLPEFIELDLNYRYFNKMDTQLLFDFARSCPHLDTIQIIDYNPATTFRRTRLGD